MREPTPSAGLRAMQHKDPRMANWRAYADRFMAFNERRVLRRRGLMSHQAMTTIAHERYERFDAARHRAEALEAHREDLRELEQVEKRTSSWRTGKGGKDAA